MDLKDLGDFILAVSPCVALFLALLWVVLHLHHDNQERLRELDRRLDTKE